MRIIEPHIFVPLEEISKSKLYKIECYARVCYKSESKTSDVNPFINNIISSGHESVIEHEKATVLIVTDRGVTHEIVRHRLASYSQESTRYCNYSSSRFGEEISVINPYFYNDNRKEHFELWKTACESAEKTYLSLINNGQPQEARSVLPNSLKTEIVTTFNFREWRHFFKLRCAPNAHPQMRQISIPLLRLFKEKLTCLFDDIPYDKNFPAKYYAQIYLTNELFEPISN